MAETSFQVKDLTFVVRKDEFEFRAEAIDCGNNTVFKLQFAFEADAVKRADQLSTLRKQMLQAVIYLEDPK